MTSTTDRFESICLALTDASFYPHAVRRIERRDTHISAVFLTGNWVYKLKKPVDFGFLDFTTLEARRRFCLQEVTLNQRLSHGVYHSVVEICEEGPGRFRLGGPGEVVEVAVRMKELPEASCLRSIVHGNGSVERAVEERLASELGDLGMKLARFYAASDRSPAIDEFGEPDRIAFNMEENFEQIDPFVDDLVPRGHWELIREVSRAFFRDHQPLLLKRVAEGRIRDGHGDLRTDHIYLVDGIQIIDCIEFNNRFRYGDAALDLAFLHMDFEHLGRSDLSLLVLEAYVREAGDPELYGLLDFYAAYRAIVKLKVSCLRFAEVQDPEERASLRQQAVRYLDQAYRYTIQFSRPTLWVFCGLPATGKSCLAEGLGSALSIRVLQTDQIRKELEGKDLHEEGVVPYDTGIYRRERRNRVYAHMLSLAMEELKHGRSAILDGSFSQRKWRDEARLLAEDLDTNILIVACSCEESILRERLREREGRGGTSDARIQHLPRMIQEFEPVTEGPPDTVIPVSTAQPADEVLQHVLTEAHRLRRSQVQRLMQNRL
ncbi:MAG: AAA family ATPase [Syntrophobacteraceae bacterium]|nr:AAA family ATPase [Syntrophobacteraceae bacterium]